MAIRGYLQAMTSESTQGMAHSVTDLSIIRGDLLIRYWEPLLEPIHRDSPVGFRFWESNVRISGINTDGIERTLPFSRIAHRMVC